MIRAFKEALGIEIRDGYGQTETGQLTGNPVGEPVRPGSMGRPLPGVALEVIDGELVLSDPRTDPTFFVGHLDGERCARATVRGTPATGCARRRTATCTSRGAPTT